MKFGQILAARSLPGWRYISYDLLKRMLDSSDDSSFFVLLLQEIVNVDTFFHALQHLLEVATAKSSEELPSLAQNVRSFAVLNYLAVLKILKKHDKMRSFSHDLVSGLSSAEVHERLRAADFCACLYGSAVFTRTAALIQSTVPETAKESLQCPVCMESVLDPAVLPCQHSFCWRCLTDCAAHGISTCPLCRQEQSLEPVNLEIETVLGCLAERYYPRNVAPAKDVHHDNPEIKLKVMTWNICSLAFPLHLSPLQFTAGLLLGCWWHHAGCDVSLQLNQKASRLRVLQQAEYIRSSGADLVMLQEVLSSTVVRSLRRHLSTDYDFFYAECCPQASALIAWVAFLLIMAALQLAMLQSGLSFLSSQADVIWLHLVARWLSLAAILAVRWRDSVPAHFLLGDVAGQLVVLRRKNCGALAQPDFCVDGFQAFDGAFRTAGAVEAQRQRQQPQTALETPCWLDVFFNVRPRGLLTINVPVVVGGQHSNLTVINTHMPHNSDNTELLWQLASLTAQASQKGQVLLAGDFNTLPDISISHQFAPLLHTGNVMSNEHDCLTWDLSQALTRKNDCTPRSMQLDFIFLQEQKQPHHQQEDHRPVRMEVLSTRIVDTSKFFKTGAPLSDHYGLASDIRLACKV